MSAEEKSVPMESLAYEEALSRLEDIVNHLERGDLTLEESMRRFEEAIALSRVCSQRLAVTEARIRKLVESPEGEPRLEPLVVDGVRAG